MIRVDAGRPLPRTKSWNGLVHPRILRNGGFLRLAFCNLKVSFLQPESHWNHHLRIPFGHPDRLGRPHHCQSVLAECMADLGQGYSCSLCLHCKALSKHKHKNNTVKRGIYGNSAFFKFQDTGPRASRLKGCANNWSRGNAVLQCQRVSFSARLEDMYCQDHER